MTKSMSHVGSCRLFSLYPHAHTHEGERVKTRHDVTCDMLNLPISAPLNAIPSAGVGPNYAPARFVEMTEAKGASKKDLVLTMEHLFHMKAITTKEIKREGKGATKTIIVEVGSNALLPNVGPLGSGVFRLFQIRWAGGCVSHVRKFSLQSQ